MNQCVARYCKSRLQSCFKHSAVFRKFSIIKNLPIIQDHPGVIILTPQTLIAFNNKKIVISVISEMRSPKGALEVFYFQLFYV